MICVKMMGNLGNQLFIYAMARKMQIMYNEDIYIDLSSLKRYYYTANYKLINFNIPQEHITYDKKVLSLKERLRFNLSSKIFHIEQKISRSIHKSYKSSDRLTIRWFKHGCFYNFNRFYYDFDYCYSKNKYLYGYFQSTKYFDVIEDILKSELVVNSDFDDYDKKMIDLFNKTNSVALSIRTIYDKHGDSFILDDYYYRAMDKISELLTNPVFYIFSDNINNVKKNFKFKYPVVYIEQGESTKQIRLLYNCKNFILANSTFSWWGAYLSKNNNKVVIMPKPWDKNGKDREDLYLKNSIKIECMFEK